MQKEYHYLIDKLLFVSLNNNNYSIPLFTIFSFTKKTNTISIKNKQSMARSRGQIFATMASLYTTNMAPIFIICENFTIIREKKHQMLSKIVFK